MTSINFYHLVSTTLSESLPRLMEKAHGSGSACLIRAADKSLIDEIDKSLWTYKNDSFLPHCADHDENADHNPIVITSTENNPNKATILMMLDGAYDKDIDQYDRVLFMFNGNQEDTIKDARKRWKDYTASGHECTYWQQTETGGWQKK